MRSITRQDSESGFTLIELMVVVLIIGILVAIALPTFLGARTRAQDAGSKAILKNAVTAAAAYFVDGGTFTGFDVAGVPEAEEMGVIWVYPSAPATKGKVTINVASGDVLEVSAASQSNTAWCVKIDYGAGGTQVRGQADAHGATVAVPICTIPAW